MLNLMNYPFFCFSITVYCKGLVPGACLNGGWLLVKEIQEGSQKFRYEDFPGTLNKMEGGNTQFFLM